MRTTIEIGDYVPEDVRPKALVAEYERLLAQDLAGIAERIRLGHCPGCGATTHRPAFERLGLAYVECASCGTLWVDERPSAQALRAHYRESASERFWQTRIARETDARRVERIVQPRLDWISDSVQQYLPQATSIADVSTHLAAFGERLAGLSPFATRALVEPIARVSAEGLDILDAPLAEISRERRFDVVTLFDVLDRADDPEAAASAAFAALNPGGLLFLTGILSSGFDIQTLWASARSVLPPDRLTMLSATGMTALLERSGFEIVELSTPGAFDVAAVVEAARTDPTLPLPRFVRTLLEHRGEMERSQFQAFLQASLLSSFGRVLARRPR